MRQDRAVPGLPGLYAQNLILRPLLTWPTSDPDAQCRPQPRRPSEEVRDLKLRPDALVLNTNSVERADAGKAFLLELLGDLVGQPLTSMQSLESALADHERRTEGGEPEPEPLDPETADLVVREVMDQHYSSFIRQHGGDVGALIESLRQRVAAGAFTPKTGETSRLQ